MAAAREHGFGVRAGVAASLAAAVLTTCVETPERTAAALAQGTPPPVVEGEAAASESPLGPTEQPAASPAPFLQVEPGPVPAPLPGSPPPEAPAEVPAPPPADGAPVGGAPAGGVPAGPAGAAVPVPVPTPAAELAPVTPQQPRIRLTGQEPEEADALAEARAVPGVTFATGVRVGEIAVDAEGGPQPVQVAAVDPADFRVLTPSVTAEATAVWQRVLEGDAAFTHDAGRRFQVQLGQQVAADGTPLRIGAYASNGVPPVADAVVSEATGQTLGLQGAQDLLVALAPEADVQQVADALTDATGLAAQLLEQPTTQRAFLTGADSTDAFQPFSYVDNGDGTIQIDPTWVEENIVRAPMPILTGEVVCHRLMVDQLRGALQEIQDSGLAGLIDPTQYGGCWVARHIDWNPSRPLSMHGWGLAADFNVSTNGLGQTPQMDPRIVEIFKKWGFVWGGDWRRPDGMHFELGRLLAPGEG